MFRRYVLSLTLAGLFLGARALAANVDVSVGPGGNHTFSPATVTIDAGDTVTWHWTSDTHTVTSGTGSSDPAVGALFDAPITTSNRTFIYQFRVSGTFPYFCRPHEGDNMRGTVIVRCNAGDVNTGSGARADVLTVNGSAGDPNRVVTVPIGSPITVALGSSPSGPASGNYVMYVWVGSAMNERDLVVSGTRLGCFVNPTPLHRGQTPQPFRCLKGTGMPASVCAGVTELRAPGRTPFSVQSPGFPRRMAFLLQCLVQDNGAANVLRFSISNAVNLLIQ